MPCALWGVISPTERGPQHDQSDRHQTAICPCPPWCTLSPGQRWDSIHDDGRRSRGHGGSDCGPHLAAGADEFADAPGVLEHVVQHHAEGVNITDQGALLDLVSQAKEAAQWLGLRQVEQARVYGPNLSAP